MSILYEITYTQLFAFMILYKLFYDFFLFFHLSLYINIGPLSICFIYS